MLNITYCERIVGANMLLTLTADELAKVEARFLAKTVADPATGCLTWTAAVNNTGYGCFWVTTTTISDAHRAAFVFKHGEAIPAGLVVRHRCHNPLCVNPDHLELGTKADNSRDMVEAGRSLSRLAPDDAHRIRGYQLLGLGPKQTAEEVGVTVRVVDNVRAGIRHVTAMDAHLDAVLAAGPAHVTAAALDPAA